jgi:hypothetical protein
MEQHRGAVERIETARDRVNQDRREVRAELCALERFADRVERLDAGSTGGAAPGGVTVLSRSSTDVMADVREAYRSTVMDVEHYEDVYGEELRTNVAAELTPEIANAMSGTAPTVPAGFTQAVLSAVGASADCRRSHLGLLDDEEASLTKALGALEEVLDGLADPTRSDRACLARLDAIAAARQPEIQRRTGRASGHELCSYLYEGEPWTYPVLSAVATVRQSVDPDD